MDVKDFYYDLPEELIAQTPIEKRDESRLMVLNKENQTIEHKHFLNQKCAKTIVSYEYPAKFTEKSIPFYTVNDDKNNKLYLKYAEKASECPRVIFGGILGKYQYNDMDETFQNAIRDAKQFLKERQHEN